MTLEELNAENIANLTSLWKKMGTLSHTSTSIDDLYVSTNWPNRCWFERQANVDNISALAKRLPLLDQNLIVPVWDKAVNDTGALKKILIDHAFEMSFEQSAMYLNLENYTEINHRHLEVTRISSGQDIKTWTTITAQSFAYEIDLSVIQRVATKPGVRLLLASIDNQPVAAAMLYKTSNLIGVHQLGVIGKYRGKGVARALMQNIIKRCKQQAVSYILLQASEMGERLYLSLGFKRQFIIQNYRRRVGYEI